jgi:hypothetical protein
MLRKASGPRATVLYVTREWIPPLWLALVLGCMAAVAATVAAFMVDAKAAAVPGALAIALLTVAFRRSGRSEQKPASGTGVEGAMLDTLMTIARDLADGPRSQLAEQQPSSCGNQPVPDEQTEPGGVYI